MQLHNQVGFMFSFGLCFFLNISQILQNSFTKIKMYSLSTTWSKVTKNYQHFRWNKRCAQSNLLNYIAPCDILQTFKTFHIALNYISVIMAFRPVCLTAVAVFCFPIVKLLNQSYLDTMVIGMPFTEKTLLVKNSHNFCMRAEKARYSGYHIIQWKQSYGVDRPK